MKMDFTDWVESILTGSILLIYALLQLFGAANSIRRRLQAERSAILGDSDAQSAALLRYFDPKAKVHQSKEVQGLVPKAAQVSIDFEDLGICLKSSGQCILNGVTGRFRAGSMAAILGPSGAGKTTFMNALCDKAHYGRQTGEIYVNGKKTSISALKRIRGFVPQDDIVHEKLTVRENLWYSARLGNPDFSAMEVENIVDDVLNVMQLTHVQHIVVGDSEERGISGGQKKRVNIGIELVTRPSVLMLDEPTSGLDSTTALSIIHSLKNLADMGMTVIMSIHQPRYSLFEMFDDVLLLGLGGRTVYLGPSDGALPYFETLGFELPQNENPADWFMDVIAGKVSNSSIKEFKPNMLFPFWLEQMSRQPASSPRPPSPHSAWLGSPQAKSAPGSPTDASPSTKSDFSAAPGNVERETCDKTASADVEEGNCMAADESHKSLAFGMDVSPRCAPCPSPERDPSAWRLSLTEQPKMVCIPEDPFMLSPTPSNSSLPSPTATPAFTAALTSEVSRPASPVQKQSWSKLNLPAPRKALLSPKQRAEHGASSPGSPSGPTLLGSPKRTTRAIKPALPAEFLDTESQKSPRLEIGRYDLLQQSLDEKWCRIDLDQDGLVNREEFSGLLTLATDLKPSEAVLDELTLRMDFEDGVLTKDKLLHFLLDLQGPVTEHVVMLDVASPLRRSPVAGATPASRRYPSTQIKRSASVMQFHSLNLFSQYVVLLHQTAVRWLRQWKQRAFSMGLIIAAGLIFGHESMGKLTVESPMAPLRLNVSHCALGLMTAMPCLQVFGGDRPIFWRMSSSGLNVLAFFLARITLCAVDVMLFTYVFTSVWYVTSAAPYNFWTYFRAYRLSAMSGATWGVLVSTLIPPHSSTLAVAVVILVMGSAISEPMAIAESPGTYKHWLALFSPFTYSVGQNYLDDVDEAGREHVFFLSEEIVNGYLDVMHFGNWQHTFASYVASATLALLTLTAAYLGLRFTHRGKQV